MYSEAGFDFGVCVVPGFGLIRLAVPSPASPPATVKPNRVELAAPAKPALARSSTDSLVVEFHAMKALIEDRFNRDCPLEIFMAI